MYFFFDDLFGACPAASAEAREFGIARGGECRPEGVGAARGLGPGPLPDRLPPPSGASPVGARSARVSIPPRLKKEPRPADINQFGGAQIQSVQTAIANYLSVAIDYVKCVILAGSVVLTVTPGRRRRRRRKIGVWVIMSIGGTIFFLAAMARIMLRGSPGVLGGLERQADAQPQAPTRAIAAVTI